MPGPYWKRNSTGETAKDAAGTVRTKAPSLRVKTLNFIEKNPATPEQVYKAIIASGTFTVLTTIRSRCSELVRMGLIADSGDRGRGEGGCAAIIWRATTAEERAVFNARKAAEAEHGEGLE